MADSTSSLLLHTSERAVMDVLQAAALHNGASCRSYRLCLFMAKPVQYSNVCWGDRGKAMLNARRLQQATGYLILWKSADDVHRS